MRKFVVTLIFWSRLALAADPPQDAASLLAQILAQKGTISADDLNRVEATGSQDRVTVLATILRAKGVLETADIAKLSSPALNADGQSPPQVAPGPSSQSPAAQPRSLLRHPMPLRSLSRPNPKKPPRCTPANTFRSRFTGRFYLTQATRADLTPRMVTWNFSRQPRNMTEAWDVRCTGSHRARSSPCKAGGSSHLRRFVRTLRSMTGIATAMV